MAERRQRQSRKRKHHPRKECGTDEPTDQIEDKADYHIMDCERYLWSYLGEQRGTGESVIIPPYDPLADLSWDWYWDG